ncbi:hemolysin III family protein [Yoonia sp. R2331]|uniref:PAQR family membrane homeostasis protein TrhA n=1 Tax=Yoonia sp. R2331 TaxID=3237238 RepID=UPI0034E4E5CC
MYPAYDRSERIADGAMHTVGVIGALAGAAALSVWSVMHLGPGEVVALGVYAATLIATFCASAFYHMTPWESLRPTLRRIDHAAIYLKIAGTYTPLVVLIGSGFAYALLALVWALAVFGMIKKLFFWSTPGRFGPALYLAMGWMGVAVIWSALPILPVSATALIAAGGLLYTIGVVFFSWERLRYSLAIWHGFVVAASACLFAAIALGVTAAP